MIKFLNILHLTLIYIWIDGLWLLAIGVSRHLQSVKTCKNFGYEYFCNPFVSFWDAILGCFALFLYVIGHNILNMLELSFITVPTSTN